MALALVAVTLATFASPWYGHDRSLSVTRTGRAEELLLDSCCHRVVELRFRISQPRGTPANATATATVTFVHVFDRTFRPPRVGATGTLRVRRGMLLEPFTGTNFCRPSRGGCGA